MLVAGAQGVLAKQRVGCTVAQIQPQSGFPLVYMIIVFKAQGLFLGTDGLTAPLAEMAVLVVL